MEHSESGARAEKSKQSSPPAKKAAGRIAGKDDKRAESAEPNLLT